MKHRFLVLIALVPIALVLTACAEPRATITPEGRLDILAPLVDFSPGGMDAGWVVEGSESDARAAFGMVRRDGVPALSVTPRGEDFLAARRTRAMLLASPYLSWAWNVEAAKALEHPVRLVVGFQGGRPEAEHPSWTVSSWRTLKTSLPAHDRAIVLVWSDSALQRGTLIEPQAQAPDAPALDNPPRYIVRGGRENAGNWWLESVDIGELYQRLWPHDKRVNVAVAFVGIDVDGVDGVDPGPSARVSGIRLSH